MILWLIEFLPYLWVVTVPVYGSFCGIDLILRISILLYVYVIAGEMVPKSMVSMVRKSNVNYCFNVGKEIKLYLSMVFLHPADSSTRFDYFMRMFFYSVSRLKLQVLVGHKSYIYCQSQVTFFHHFLTILNKNTHTCEKKYN